MLYYRENLKLKKIIFIVKYYERSGIYTGNIRELFLH